MLNQRIERGPSHSDLSRKIEWRIWKTFAAAGVWESAHQQVGKGMEDHIPFFKTRRVLFDLLL